MTTKLPVHNFYTTSEEVEFKELDDLIRKMEKEEHLLKRNLTTFKKEVDISILLIDYVSINSG